MQLVKDTPLDKCPHCGALAPMQGIVCNVCIRRIDEPSEHMRSRRTTGKGGGALKWLVALVLLAAVGAGGYLLWQRNPNLLGQAKTVAVKTANEVKQVTQQVTGQLTILVALEDGLELDGCEPPLPPLHRGQPMLRKEVESDRVRVVVKTPEGDREGWAPRDEVKEDPAYDLSDLLGFQEGHPKGHQTAVTRIVFSPDESSAVSLAQNGSEVNLWSTSDGRLLRAYHGHVSSATAAGFLENGAVLSADGTAGLRAWSPVTTATLRRYPDVRNEFCLLKGGGGLIELASGTARFIDFDKAKPEACSTESDRLQIVRVAQDQSVLVAQTSKRMIQSYSLPGLEGGKGFSIPSEARFLDLSPNGQQVAVYAEQTSQSGGVTVLIPDFETGFLKEADAKPEGAQKGRHLLQLLDRKSGKRVREIPLSYIPLRACFCGDGKLLFVTSAGDKAHLSLLSPRKPTRSATFSAPEGAHITAISSGPSGTSIAIGYSTGAVEFHTVSARTGAPVKRDGGQSDGTKEAPDPEKKAKRYYDFVRQFLMNKMADQARSYYDKLAQECPESPYTAKARKELEAAGVELAPGQ